MPLSEVHKTRKTDTSQSKMTNCSSDLSSFMPDSEFVELLWENGQIVMHGQSNRPRKSFFPTSTFSHAGRAQEKESRDVDPLVNGFSRTQASGLNAQDDDMAPWINYSIEDSLQNDFFSEYMPEFPGGSLNPVSAHTNAVLSDKSSGLDQTGKSSRNVEQLAGGGGSVPGRIKSNQLFQLSQERRSKATEGLSARGASSTHQGLSSSRLEKQGRAGSRLSQSTGSIGLMNFSHFSRPVALAKANLQSLDRWRSNEKSSTATTSSNPMESTVIGSTGRLQSFLATPGMASAPPKEGQGSSSKPRKEGVLVKRSDGNGDGNVSNNNSILPDCINLQSSNIAAAAIPSGRNETAKGTTEAVVASSSVCSANGAGAASNDPKHRAKRKTYEGEESGNQSEDHEDESMGLKKSAAVRGTSTKRSRAAEVHNLSERRRRDRINEKMRALQELIPNCNKVDKASMLDEAIEYLKSLQLQVQIFTQIMSMGGGSCMLPFIPPAGIQHMRLAPMAHLPQMGVGMEMGMGMRLGYGMGMLDMNGPAGCPLLPVPPMHGPQFPFPSIPGTQCLHGMMPTSTGLPMFGLPGQGLPASMPHTPPLCSLSGLSAAPNSMPGSAGMTKNPLTVTDIFPSSTFKDQHQQSLDLEKIQKTSTDDSQISTSAQEPKESIEQSALVQTSNRTSHVSGNGVRPKKGPHSPEQPVSDDSFQAFTG